jgi:proteasome alpha subunit
MSFMPYVAPEQMMKDRSDYAHKGIARGRSVVGLEYADGLLFIAENPSTTLHKISEIYDHVAFAGVGKYSEFEELRIAGIRLADMRGYSYGREDVKARDLANAYSQALSAIFTQQMKPYEVEILVGEVDGETGDGCAIYHILFTTPEPREIPPGQIEAAVLDRTRPQRRKFRRLAPDEVAGFLT